MALTPIQRDVCRLLAEQRRASGESYVPAGVALTDALAPQRPSRDPISIHDTTEAVAMSWDADRKLLEPAGFVVAARRERPGFVEAAVSRDGDILSVEWMRDSAHPTKRRRCGLVHAAASIASFRRLISRNC